MDVNKPLALLLLLVVLSVHVLSGQAFNLERDPCETLVCPHFLDPVCGIFEAQLISFPNQCEFEQYICKVQKQGRSVRLGECPDWHVFARKK